VREHVGVIDKVRQLCSSRDVPLHDRRDECDRGDHERDQRCELVHDQVRMDEPQLFGSSAILADILVTSKRFEGRAAVSGDPLDASVTGFGMRRSDGF
jgi:hypothetical protein